MPAHSEISRCKICRRELNFDEGWIDRICDACRSDIAIDEAEREHDIEEEERYCAEMEADDEAARAEDARLDRELDEPRGLGQGSP